MKPRDRTDVEAAKLRSLLARRHVHTGHFGQVLVSGGAGHLSPQVIDWPDLRGEQEQYETPMNEVLAMSDPPGTMLLVPLYWAVLLKTIPAAPLSRPETRLENEVAPQDMIDTVH